MKKLTLAVLLALSATANAADNFGHIQLVHRNTLGDNAGNPNRHGVNITLGHKLANNFSLDFSGQQRQENGSNGTDSTRLEIGATPQNEKFYIRTALGVKSNDESHLYYSIEPGLRWTLSPKLSAKTAYRYRDAFSNSNDQTHTARLGLEYAVTDTQSVTAGYDRSFGDSEFNGFALGYAIKY
jgi:opacity protein-like surface antigen